MTATGLVRGDTPWTVDDVFDRPASIRSMAILRIALAPVVLVHLAPFLSATARGRTYDDHFWMPWWRFLPEFPGGVQTVLVWAAALAAVVMGAGWHSRWAAAVTFTGVAGNLFLSQTYFHHNRAFLLFLLGGVALSDSGRVLSLDARRHRRSGFGPGDDRATVWPLFTLRALVSSVYLASGFSKLIDPDWVGGLVLWDRSVRAEGLIRERLPAVLADPVVDVVTTRWVHAVTSPTAVATELFIGVGLWLPRTRLAAVWLAVAFHLSIELTASVEVFSVAAVAALVIWATPSTRDRTVVVDDPRWIRRLDWLARFDVRAVPGAALQVVDRDGSVHAGRSARWLVASRLPVTFFFVAPLRRWWR